MTKTTIAKLEEAFALGCTDEEATLYANISPATLYLFQDKNPGFSERKALLKETPILQARAAVIKGFKRSPELALKFLERRKRDEFSLKREEELTLHKVEPILGGRSMRSEA